MIMGGSGASSTSTGTRLSAPVNAGPRYVPNPPDTIQYTDPHRTAFSPPVAPVRIRN